MWPTDHVWVEGPPSFKPRRMSFHFAKMFQAKPPRSGLAADTAIESAFAAADGAAASALRLSWKCTCRGTDKAQLKLTMPGTSLPVFNTARTSQGRRHILQPAPHWR